MKEQYKASPIHLLLIALLLLVWAHEAHAGVGPRIDYLSKPAPAVSFPAAGGTYTDPVFGTQIIRVTDASHGTHCTHSYSYWPALNATNTLLLLTCDYSPKIYKFDPSTDTVTPNGLLWGSDGPHVQAEGATWSLVNPEKIFAVDAVGLRLWRINTNFRGASGYRLIRDFSDKFDSSEMLEQMTMSEDENVFAFRIVSRADGSQIDSAVWVRDTDTLYVFKRYTDQTVNEISIAKDGSVAEVYFNSEDVAIWNFRAGTKTWLHKNVASENPGGHYDIGRHYIVNDDLFTAGVVARTLSALTPAVNILTFKRPDGSQNWSLSANHISLRTADEEFFIGSTYGGDGPWGAFENEIFLGYTDGHGFVRLAHTYSNGGESGIWSYWAQPRAVVSHDGHFVVYTSDLGSTDRLDVMILKVPKQYWPQ